MDHLGHLLAELPCCICVLAVVPCSSGAGNVPEPHCQQAQGSWTQMASALLPKYNTAPPKMAFQEKTAGES